MVSVKETGHLARPLGRRGLFASDPFSRHTVRCRRWWNAVKWRSVRSSRTRFVPTFKDMLLVSLAGPFRNHVCVTVRPSFFSLLVVTFFEFNKSFGIDWDRIRLEKFLPTGFTSVL